MTAPNRLSPFQFVGGLLVVARREVGAYFDSAIAYVYSIAFVILANSIFMNEFFLTGTVDMQGFFDLLPLLLAFFLPAITMRLWAEERRQRTLEVLLTLPLQPLQVILGKYCAALLLFCLFLIGSLPIVFMLTALGDPDLPRIAAGYGGVFLFGALFLSFGMLLSALSGDQIVAFVLTTVVGFAFVLSGNAQVAEVVDGLAPALSIGSWLRDNISVMPHHEAFSRGLIQASSGVYFLGFIVTFLWCNALALRSNRA